MRSIDNVRNAIGSALAEGLDLSYLAVTAWHKNTVSRLDAAIVPALGYNNPEVTVDDIYPNATVATVADIVGEHVSWPSQSCPIDPEDRTECEDEYLELIRRVSEGTIRSDEVRKKIRAAIRLSVAARLYCMTLEERFRKTSISESFSFVAEVARYYHDYKQQNGRKDIADMFELPILQHPECPLCLMHHRSLPPLGMRALRRVFPSAHFCTVAIS